MSQTILDTARSVRRILRAGAVAAIPSTALGRDGVTSVQALNEFTDVARRKLGMSWQEVREALAAIRILCQTFVPVDIDTHADALRIAKRSSMR